MILPRRVFAYHVQLVFTPLILFLDQVNLSTDTAALENFTMQKAFADKWRSLDTLSSTRTHVKPSVEDAIEFIRSMSAPSNAMGEPKEVHALITGSVHLVGRVLGTLEDADAV